MEVESPKERHNRELIELLNELRVLLPGVQVLFAFLLAVPFTARFAEIGDAARALFFVTLCNTALAALFLIAPSAIHRIDFRLIDKGAMVRIANRLAIAGIICVALAMVGALTLIAQLLYGGVAALVVAAVSAALFGGGWFVMPLRWRQSHPQAPRHDP
jgi:hypothetical protein